MNVDGRLPIVMALTGASGAPYGIRLLQQLAAKGHPVSLIVSSHGFRLLRRHDRSRRDAVLGYHGYRSLDRGPGDEITQVTACFLDWQRVRHRKNLLPLGYLKATYSLDCQ